MQVPIFWRILPIYIVTIVLVAFPIYRDKLDKVEASRASIDAQQKLSGSKEASSTHISGNPSRIIIPRLGIDLQVISSQYDSAKLTWPVASDASNYAVNTAKNNDFEGKTLIYGHKTQGVFGKTKMISAGDEVFVYTDNNHIFRYTYAYDERVSPINTQLFASLAGKPGLVLMTCDGTWDQQRRIMFFELSEAI